MIARTLVAASALVASAAVTPAAAEPFAFRYKPYELETQGGRADLEARLDRMVERYCDKNGVRGISARRASGLCREATLAEVRRQIDAVEVASLDR